MIEVIQDNEGRVIAYTTIFHVTKYLEFSTEFTAKELCIAYIDSFWKHKSCKLKIKECIKIMVNNHLEKYPNLHKAHFNRHHNDGRASSKFHWYGREQMMSVKGFIKGDNNG